MRIAMFQLGLSVPPRAGADMHTTKIAAELQKHGHSVVYVTCELDQTEPLPFPVVEAQPADEDEASQRLPSGRVFRNLMHYWATSPGRLRGVQNAVLSANAQLCIGSGIHGLLALHVLEGMPRIWYAGDELVVNGLSQLRLANGLSRNATLMSEISRVALFTRMSRDVAAEVWVVAEKDARSMRRITGRDTVIVIPNGVDLDYYRPSHADDTARTAVFWGRLDFGPNEQAVEMLTRTVWPLVRQAEPSAELIVMGFSPSERVRRLVSAPGVRLVADAPDIRPVVCSAPVALYPFVSGSGIKNKLLEGAAMERALLVSPTAIDGLVPTDPRPWRVCKAPEQWRDALLGLWRSPQQARSLGRAARAWVEARHSWTSAGELAAASVRRVARLRQ